MPSEYDRKMALDYMRQKGIPSTNANLAAVLDYIYRTRQPGADLSGSLTQNLAMLENPEIGTGELVSGGMAGAATSSPKQMAAPAAMGPPTPLVPPVPYDASMVASQVMSGASAPLPVPKPQPGMTAARTAPPMPMPNPRRMQDPLERLMSGEGQEEMMGGTRRQMRAGGALDPKHRFGEQLTPDEIAMKIGPVSIGYPDMQALQEAMPLSGIGVPPVSVGPVDWQALMRALPILSLFAEQQ